MIKILGKVRGRFSSPTIFIGLALGLLPLYGAFSGWPIVTSVFALALIAVGCLTSLIYFRKKLNLGPKWIYIPLLIILGSGLLRTIIGGEGLNTSGTYMLYLLIMFGLFMTVRIKGESVLWIVVPIVIVYGTCVLVDEVMNLGFRASGLSGNPNLIAAMLAFCIFFLRGKWKWLIPLALAAIVCTGSYWALGALVVCGLFKLVRPGLHLGEGLFGFTSGLLAVVVVLLLVLGAFGSVWNVDKVSNIFLIAKSEGFVEGIDSATHRLDDYRYVRDNFSFFGNGLLNASQVTNYRVIHNVPLMIADELGILAALAWLFTMVFGIYKVPKYRLVLLVMLLISVTGCYWFWHWASLGTCYWLTMGLVSKESMPVSI